MSLSLDQIREQWVEAWPRATELWSRFLQLSEPVWSTTAKQDQKLGLTGSFAFIRLHDQRICISLHQVQTLGIEPYSLEILAHEIGHHVYAPGDLLDNGRALARVRAMLPTLEHRAPMVLNIYEDLLINDRLFRFHEISQVPVFVKLNQRDQSRPSELWQLYMRIYEILWSQTRGTLTPQVERRIEADAQLGAKLIRSYGRDWIGGAGSFALLLLEYLLKEPDARVKLLLDADKAGLGGSAPHGLVEIDAGEGSDLHPAEGSPQEGQQERSSGQFREPFEYGALLKALGFKLSDHEVAARYYRERALPYLIPFPSREVPESLEPQLEGTESWEVGHPLEAIDWLESVLVSPHIVPGFTTVQRVVGLMAGSEPEREPLDLDLYVDCSGSMPDPQRNLSYLTLAGAIVCLSCLRAGGRVQATLWSGTRQFKTTGGFVSKEAEVMHLLTGYLSGATAFPLHMFRETYSGRNQKDRAVHILVLSDDGVDTMAQTDEKGNDGMELSRMALANARGGGTLALLLDRRRLQNKFFQAIQQQGWSVFCVNDWSQLLEFARAFSRSKFAEEVTA